MFICKIIGVTGREGSGVNGAATPGIKDKGEENRAVSDYLK